MKMMNSKVGSDDRKQKVLVVILTGGIDWILSWIGIQWPVNGLCLSPGDELILLAVLQLINPPLSPAFSFAKILGYKGEGDAKEDHGPTRKFVAEELRRQKQEHHKNPAFIQLHKLCENHRIKVRVEVEAGSSRKEAAIRAAKKLKATWIVLDREMKKDKQYFMDRLSCGMSSMKSNHTIKKLRDPATVKKLRAPTNEHVSYDEMIPSYSREAISPSKSPGDRIPGAHKAKTFCCSSKPLFCNSQSVASTSGFMETRSTLLVQEIENDTTKQVVVEESTHRATESPKDDHSKAFNMLWHNEGRGRSNKIQKEQEFEFSICSVCHNKRVKFGPQSDFSYSELYEATGRFSGHNFLSEGGFGSVYKGKLKNGLKVAVKQLKAASLQGEKEFKSEVHVLSQARHQNLVVLLGSCAEGSHRLLVYEYICNGSLEKHLSGDSSRPLDWEQRIKIATGAARGLSYLHAQNIVHRDMRPGNILITHDYETLLGDFGLARAQKDDVDSCSTGLVGTLGYMAPEYAESGKMSTKTDVYAFGVVLLQLITGRSTTDEIPGGKSLVGWAKPLLETKNYPDLIDKRILDSHDVHQLFWMVLVAEKCLKKDPNNRWTMEQVTYSLRCIREGKTSFYLDLSPTKEDSSCRILD